jgi:lycopene cyclase domain-containing protein
MEYLIILSLVFLLSFSFHRISKLDLFDNFWQGFAMFLSVLIIGGLWDNYAVLKGHWFYPGEGILGIFVLYLPLEDYIFILVVTYAIIVGYSFYRKHIKIKK